MENEEHYEEHYEYTAIRRGNVEIACIIIDDQYEPETTHLTIYNEEDRRIMSFISPEEIYDFTKDVMITDTIYDDLHLAMQKAHTYEWI